MIAGKMIGYSLNTIYNLSNLLNTQDSLAWYSRPLHLLHTSTNKRSLYLVSLRSLFMCKLTKHKQFMHILHYCIYYVNI